MTLYLEYLVTKYVKTVKGQAQKERTKKYDIATHDYMRQSVTRMFKYLFDFDCYPIRH